MSLQQQFLSHDGLVNCKFEIKDDVTATATAKEKQVPVPVQRLAAVKSV